MPAAGIWLRDIMKRRIERYPGDFRRYRFGEPVHAPARSRRYAGMASIAFVMALTLGACAMNGAKEREGARQDDETARLLELEERVRTLERRVLELEQAQEQPIAIPIPYRSKQELREHVAKLRQEREMLLERYTEQHPAIIDIDRQIRILDAQIRLLEQYPDLN